MEIWGIILILFSGIGIAIYLIGGSQNVLNCAKAALELLTYTKNAVDNYSMPAAEILAGCKQDIIFNLGYDDCKRSPESFLELCDGAQMSDRVSAQILLDFAKGFGKNQRRQQSEDCQRAIEKLRLRVSELEGELPMRKKMILSICISVALVLIILLL